MGGQGTREGGGEERDDGELGGVHGEWGGSEADGIGDTGVDGSNEGGVSGYDVLQRSQNLLTRRQEGASAERENRYKGDRYDIELSVVYLNMNGIGIDERGHSYKMDLLHSVLMRIRNRTRRRVDVVCICETKLGGSFYLERAAARIHFYVAARMDRKAGAGGVAILVHRSIDAQPMECAEAYDESGAPRVEICAARLTGMPRPWQIVVGYRPPDGSASPTRSPEAFFGSFEDRVEAAEEVRGTATMCGGDFNWDGMHLEQEGTAHACRPGWRGDSDVAAQAAQGAQLTRVSGTRAQCPIPGDEHTYVTVTASKEHDFVFVGAEAADDVMFCRALADIGWPYEDHLPMLTLVACGEGTSYCPPTSDPHAKGRPTPMWRDATDLQIGSYADATSTWCQQELARLRAPGGERVNAAECMGRIADALRSAERAHVPAKPGGAKQWHAPCGYEHWGEEEQIVHDQAATAAQRARAATSCGQLTEARAEFARSAAARRTLERLRRERFIAKLFGVHEQEQHRAFKVGMAYEVLTRVIARGRLGRGKSARAPPHEFRGLRHPISRERVSGLDAVIEALDAGLRHIYADDPGFPGFDRKAHDARVKRSDHILSFCLPASIERGRRANERFAEEVTAGRRHSPDWAEWESAMRRGERTPTQDELDVYCSLPYDAAESAAARASTASDKAPHPVEQLRPEAVKFAGDAFDELFAHVCNRMDEQGGAEPAMWSEYYARWLYKGKGDRLDFLSYRDIVLATMLGKLRERIILARLRAVTAVDQLQGLENHGTDVRHQNALLLDMLIHRDVLGLRTWVAAIDIRRAFPSLHRRLVVCILWMRGVRGRLLQAFWFRLKRVVYIPAVRDGVLGRPVRAGISMPMGTVISPRIFTLVIDTLQGELRLLVDPAGRRIGVHVNGTYMGSLLFMDDVIAAADSKDDLLMMIQAVLQWGFVNRLEVHPDKLVIMATRPDDLSILAPGGDVVERTDTAFSGVFVPETDDAEEQAAATRTFQKTVQRSLKYLDLRIGADVGAALAQHRAARVAIARRSAERMLAGTSDLGVLSVRMKLLAWTSYARALVEDVAAQPPLTGRQLSAVERVQDSALAALFDVGLRSPSGECKPPARAVMLVIFGLQRMATRMTLRRLGFAYALSVARQRPGGRAELIDAFDSESIRSAEFRRRSPTGATWAAVCAAAAAAEHGDVYGVAGVDPAARAWPDPDIETKAQFRSRCRRAMWAAEDRHFDAEVWNMGDGAGNGVARRASARLLRAMNPTVRWLDAEVLDARASKGRLSFVACVAGSAWFGSCVSRRGRSYTHAQEPGVSASQAEVEADEFEAGDDEGGDREDRGPRFDADDERDAARVPRRGGDDGAGHAAGRAAWAGTVGTVGASEIAATEEARFVCSLCGQLTVAPDVHAICGHYRGEAPCGGAQAGLTPPAARAEFLRETDECWARHAGAPVPGLRGTYAELAARVGGARGIPPALAADLARAYERTWGRWAALRTTEVGPRYLPAGEDDDEAGGT